jgi:DNA (cytosine-5)-methyltransferase 1
MNKQSSSATPLSAVELFAGAGGLALGTKLAGFDHRAVIEWDRWACDTIRENQRNHFQLVSGWPLHQGDVREYDYTRLGENIDLVAGGPPCQPFSIGGKHRGFSDDRDMFPVAAEVIRQLRPRVFLLENVKGLSRPAFHNYFEYTKLRLAFPADRRRSDETWLEHYARLEERKTSKPRRGLRYVVLDRLLNAADFGVPQKRERVFIVGFRSDLDANWNFPDPTHSQDALLADKWVTGNYWDRHRVARKSRPEPHPRLARRLERLAQVTFDDKEDVTKPWRTVRDALSGLPDPRDQRHRTNLTNHRYQPGAKTYKGHTGSPYDEPAKTLKAGDHGVPGGENMLALEDGSVRYFTVRESARLQTFPDDYVFHGTWSETMRQLGNAVPVTLAEVVARSIAKRLVEQ